MRQALADLLRRLLHGSRFSPQEVLWALLIGTFVVSVLHLTTMFLTRWGNRRITGKALLCSLLLHLAFAVSIVTVAPAPSIPQGGGQDKEEHRILIRGVPMETPREARNEKSDAAQTPVWDRLPAPKAVKRPGPTPNASPATTPPKIERLAEHAKPSELKAPELASLPEIQQAPPIPAINEATPAKKSSPTPKIETPKSQPLSKPAPQVPSPRPHGPAPLTASESKVGRVASDSPGNGSAPKELSRTDLTPITPLETPQSPVAQSAPEGQTGPKPAAAPTRLRPSEASAPAPAPARLASLPETPIGTSLRKPGAQAADERHWQASVDRVRSNTLGSDGPQQSKPSAVGDYQPFDTRPPAPEVEGTANEPLLVKRSAGVPSTYRLRKLSQRKQNARQFGGNDQTERAVEASLKWLASVQNRDGHWDAKSFGAGQVKVDENGVDRDYAGRDADSGVTALTILAFLGAGYTHEEGQYADNVDRALHWLIGQQEANGNLGASAGHFAAMYCHGISTYAIAEAYGMQNDPTSNTMLREPLLRGVRYILDNQNPDGGWRYLKGQKSDISMFGWQLMALKSAEIAGVNIPREAKARMVAFLKERSLGENGGLAGYREDLPPTPAMSAEALFCKQMLGIRRDNAASREGADYLLARLPKRTFFNEYYWYYGTLAMYQYGGDGWQTWNQTMRELLVSEQRNSGEFSGSWDPVGAWGKYGGRIYSTALSTLCLEVYYRFLPLYQLGSRTNARGPTRTE